MTKFRLNWRNAQLPTNTAVFAIGDIHAHDELLTPLLESVERKIATLSSDVQAYVIFIGDYVDRGSNTPRTLDMLLDFEKRMMIMPNVTTRFLCGNHDEYVKRLLEARCIVDEPVNACGDNQQNLMYLLTRRDGSINLRGVEIWLFTGGGITTLRDYCPDIEDAFFDAIGKCFNRLHPEFSLDMVNMLMQRFIARVPQAHKDFFVRTYDNDHLILGDYLFTHAGIDPNQKLKAQGIGSGAARLCGKQYIDFLMIRDAFLWRDDLPYCHYVVVHGHTPSAIASGAAIMADGQKDYRLCIDTCVYAPNGAMTCFVRYDDEAGFIAINKTNPDHIIEYSIPQLG